MLDKTELLDLLMSEANQRLKCKGFSIITTELYVCI